MRLEELEIEEVVEFDVPENRERKSKDKDDKKEVVKDKKKKNLFQRLFNKKKLQKPNRVAVILLKNNHNSEFLELESKFGFFTINKKVYHEDKDCIYNLIDGKERYPLAVIPEDNLTPIGTKKFYEQSMQEIGQTLQNHIMKGIRHAEIVRMGEKDGSGLSGKQLVGIGVIIIIIVAVVIGYV